LSEPAPTFSVTPAAAPLPATLIAGFGATAKAPVIEALLRHKPKGESWALIAPAGLLGARYAQTATGLWVQTVAPGCPCCTGLMPFSTGLTALLRRLLGSGVTRLLIEGGAEGHIESVRRLLAQAQFAPHVQLVHATAVINPQWLDQGASAAQDALRELAGAADSLIAHPWEEEVGARAALARFAAEFTPAKPWTALAGGALEANFARAALPEQSPRPTTTSAA
jgi:hypothetical protein